MSARDESRPLKRQFVEESSHEEYTHKVVWQVVRREIEEADSNPVGSAYRHLVAMVFCAHTIEGYLNFLGEKLVPSIWKDERIFFKGRGIDGKIDFLREILELGPADRSKSPYSTLVGLRALRDSIAHPRMLAATTTTPYLEGEEPSMFLRSSLEDLVDAAKAKAARDHVKRIADELHTAAMAKFPAAGLLPDALEGVMGVRSSSLKLDEAPPAAPKRNKAAKRSV